MKSNLDKCCDDAVSEEKEREREIWWCIDGKERAERIGGIREQEDFEKENQAWPQRLFETKQ